MKKEMIAIQMRTLPAPTYRDALSMSVMAIYRQLTLVSNNRPRTTVIIFSNAVLGPQDEARS